MFKTQKFIKATILGAGVVLLIFAYPYYILTKETRNFHSKHIYNYFVWEVEVVSAKKHEGQILQIAEIRGQNLNNLTLPTERHFDKFSWEEQKNVAITHLGHSPASTEDLTHDSDFVNEIKISYLATLNSLFEGPAFEIQPKEGESEATLRIRLKKKCHIHLSIVEKTNWRKRSQGMWALPYRYTRDVLEIEKPECYDPNDKIIIKKASA